MGDEAETVSAEGESDAAGESAAGESAAGSVAGGIFLSRIFGLLRERAVAYFFGVGAHADVLQVAFKSPNLLQNLLGEGTISAAFIPIYSRLIEEERPEAAGRFAGAIFGLLLAAAGGGALLGVVFAEPIVTVLAPGFLDDAARVAAGTLPLNRFDLAVRAVRIIFPMAGVLVLSAWALGVLNSHRQFFVPYVAPTLWNAAIIATLFGGGYALAGTPGAPEALAGDGLTRLLLMACVGAFGGGLLQFGVQLPFVVGRMEGFSFSVSTRVEGVREALSAFGPVVASRGVAQLSAYLDLFLASWLAVGALSALRYAQILYMLPISLFGMSVAASELPELSRLTQEKVAAFSARLRRSLRQIAFLTVPTVVGYLAFGVLLVGALFRTGQFQAASTWLVAIVLGGYSLGILATTFSRLFQNAFYAIGDTTTPAWIAVLRVTVSTVVAVPAMFGLDTVALERVVGPLSGDGLFLGALGLSLGATVGAWVEVAALRYWLRGPLPDAGLPWGQVGWTGGLALAALGPGAVVWGLLPNGPVLVVAPVVVAAYAAVYLGAAWGLGFDEIDVWTRRLFG
ncbi:murein biosynthesis integral membrane protein MurJ [Salinibacter altiplanensis]|uniref:murein biosynthesis integral membrane protein MurJ n=1 Tax=Salinibacter altiplanensis TaxID=1803181 RepID=UPI000C9F8360|nr:murein biosynthesis integral membrane protein MurJ [Salinibacter altiplanensis]